MLKVNLGSGEHELAGFDNFDLPLWNWNMPLPYYDESVDGITISHALMYADLQEWLPAMREMWRVLVPGGIVRITEDSCLDPKSERFGGFPGCKTQTSPGLVFAALMTAGFRYIAILAPDRTGFRDRSLIQQWHGAPPKVFFVEAEK